MMAQEGSEASVVSTSSSVPNWWDVQMNSVSSSAAGWSHHMHPWQSHHHNSNSSCEEDISISTTSFTNASNHSGLSADSASATDLSGEPAENHLWNQVLLGVGNVRDLRNTHNDGENFLEVLSSKNLSTDMPEPACNYLKKLDSSWGFTTPSSLNNLEKQMGTYDGGFTQHEKLNNLSDLVNNWSIAPPAPQLGSPCISSLGTSMARYLEPNFADVKHESSTSSPYAGTGAGDVSSGVLPCFGHQMKRERLLQEFGVNSESSLLRPVSSHAGGYHIGPAVGSNKYCSSGTSVPDAPWSSTTRSFSDLVSFGDCLSKPLIDFRGSKSSVRSSDSADSRKQGHEASPLIRGSGNHPSVTSSEGKKKRSDDNSETHAKKSKQESSTTSSVKVPKVKLGEKITALQQIVAPFGKTDTASVLMETISYIRFLHEQVQRSAFFLTRSSRASSVVRAVVRDLFAGSYPNFFASTGKSSSYFIRFAASMVYAGCSPAPEAPSPPTPGAESPTSAASSCF
ncbi:hypothetical protein Taro_020486 [Colocasia esculenta]|uniref:BHLH domain-containing protein n=1 Tax=Colocasia esculenta TaxID=4460 RepID=A0A843V5D0_COLES|nr:hypothetical protein [Colocasia esculenta]